MIKRGLVIFCIIIWTLGVFSACADSSDDIVKIGYHANYGGAGSVFVASEMGYFEEEGLNVELIPFESDLHGIASLNAGIVDVLYIGQGAHTQVLMGMGEIIATQGISLAEGIVVRASSGIESIEDLKGKKIASLFGTSSEELVRIALQEVGLTFDDVQMLNYDMQGAITAIANGDVDAVSVWSEYQAKAMKILGDDGLIIATTDDFKDKYVPIASWISTEEFIDDNKEMVQSFVNAIIKSQDYWLKNINNTCAIIAYELDVPLTNLFLSVDTAELFSSSTISDHLETGYMLELYQIQQDYIISTHDSVQKRDVLDYLHLEFMQNAVDNLNAEQS